MLSKIAKVIREVKLSTMKSQLERMEKELKDLKAHHILIEKIKDAQHSVFTEITRVN